MLYGGRGKSGGRVRGGRGGRGRGQSLVDANCVAAFEKGDAKAGRAFGAGAEEGGDDGVGFGGKGVGGGGCGCGAGLAERMRVEG